MLRKLVLIIVLSVLSPMVRAEGFLPRCLTGHLVPVLSVGQMIMPSDSGREGERLAGTVWFVGPQQVIAVLHDHAEVLRDWQEIEIFVGGTLGVPASDSVTTWGRLAEEIDTGAPENLYVVELADTFDIMVPRLRFGAPADNEAVFSLGYPDGVFQMAIGRHVLPEQSTNADPGAPPPPPFLMFEMADEAERNRMAIDFGASGSPIFDCQGRLVAVVAQIMTQPMPQLAGDNSEPERISTSWGMPNVLAISTSGLMTP